MWRKFFIYLKLNWIKSIVILILTAVIIASIFFVHYCVNNFFALEEFTRRSISGQMALLLPMFVLVHLVSLPIMMGMQYYFMMGGGMGKSKVEMPKTDVRWSEVIGLEEAKKEAWELVKLLKDRALLKAIGGKIIKGTLMVGPPGCGKTYLAKAIANECDLPLLSAVGSEFVGMFIGQGTSRMKSLFKQARDQAKIHGGCIVFIDEIDSFARPRGADTGFGGGRMDMNATINQFLTEMDGLRNTENNIAVIAATNVPPEELDSAIMRAGRFDRKINVNKPNLTERKKLFEFYTQKVDTDGSLDIEVLARKTVLFSPAEIDSMVREAGLIAARDSRSKVSMKDLSDAYERVAFGQKSNVILSDEEKFATAYHEAGHAIIYYLIHPTNDVLKATVVPRAGALGYVFARPTEEKHASNRDEILCEIKVALGGYVAERIKFNTSTNGVSGDFRVAYRYAHEMVWRYGMGKSGMIGDFKSMGGHMGTPFISERTKEKLDDDVQEILQSCMKDVESLIKKNHDAFEHFSQQLYAKEELEYDEIEAIFKEFGLVRAKKPNKVETI